MHVEVRPREITVVTAATARVARETRYEPFIMDGGLVVLIGQPEASQEQALAQGRRELRRLRAAWKDQPTRLSALVHQIVSLSAPSYDALMTAVEAGRRRARGAG